MGKGEVWSEERGERREERGGRREEGGGGGRREEGGGRREEGRDVMVLFSDAYTPCMHSALLRRLRLPLSLPTLLASIVMFSFSKT